MTLEWMGAVLTITTVMLNLMGFLRNKSKMQKLKYTNWIGFSVKEQAPNCFSIRHNRGRLSKPIVSKLSTY